MILQETEFRTTTPFTIGEERRPTLKMFQSLLCLELFMGSRHLLPNLSHRLHQVEATIGSTVSKRSRLGRTSKAVHPHAQILLEIRKSRMRQQQLCFTVR